MTCTAIQREAPAARVGEHVPLDARSVAEVPDAPGVYCLYRRHRLIYIGLAALGATLRARLRHHLDGAGGPCTRSASEFDYETAADPFPLYRHYLAVYFDATGGLLPECNSASDRCRR